MKNFYYKDFVVDGKKFTFTQSHRTPLNKHKYDVDLCGTKLTIPYIEMEQAILELQRTGRYKDFVLKEHIAMQEKIEKENREKWSKHFEKAHAEQIKKEKVIKEIKEELVEFCEAKTYYLVYNKLEDDIKKDRFLIYTHGRHKTLTLKEAGIKGYKERIS